MSFKAGIDLQIAVHTLKIAIDRVDYPIPLEVARMQCELYEKLSHLDYTDTKVVEDVTSYVYEIIYTFERLNYGAPFTYSTSRPEQGNAQESGR
jgi:hypothetical protein